MTQVFNDDVNLRKQIGQSLGVPNAGGARYDLFLRNMLRDRCCGNRAFNAWLTDLEDLASAQGRLGAAGVGTESGIKGKFEWTVMRSLIQASIQLAAQDSIDGAANNEIVTKTGDDKTGYILTANLGLIKNKADGTAPDDRLLAARETLRRSIATDKSDHPELAHLRYVAVDAGASGNTTLTGSAKASLLMAFDGDDTLIAGTGATWFYGGAGSDTADFVGLWGRGCGAEYWRR